MNSNKLLTLKRLTIVTAVSLAIALVPAAHATDYTKANDTNALSDPLSWTLQIVPTSTDRGVWDSTVTAVSVSPMGGDLSWAGLAISNPGGLVTINGANTLTLGSSGIDMSAATQGLTIGTAGLAVAADQTWIVATNELLYVTNVTTSIPANVLTIAGSGTVQMGNTNNNTSRQPALTAPAGIIVSNGATLAVNIGGATFNENIIGPGTISLLGNGSPNLSAGGIPMTYTTTGTLKFDQHFNTRLQFDGTQLNTLTLGSFYIGDSNQMYLSGAAGTVLTVNGLASFGGQGFVDGDTPGDRGVVRLNNGNVAAFFNGPVTLRNDNQGRGVNFGGTGTITFNGVIDDGNPGGAGYGIKKGGSASGVNFIYGAANTYHGMTRWGGGTLNLSNQFALQNSTLNLTNSPGNGSLAFNSAVLANAFTFGGLTGNRNINLQNDAATGITLTVGNNNNTEAPYTGALNGAGSLIKIGTGNLTLTSGSSAFLGSTIINAGTITINGDGGDGGTGPLGTSPTSPVPGDLVINGALSAAATFTLDANRGIALGASGILDVTNGQTMSYNGIIADNSGAGNLTKTGGGSLILGGANTYSGSTTIGNGTLALINGGSLNSVSSISISAGGTLDLSALSGDYVMGGTSIHASGTASPASINGPSSGNVLFSALPVTLAYDGSHPALAIPQGTLSLNGNAFTINSPSQLGVGKYILIAQASGNIISNGNVTFSGTALGAPNTIPSLIVGSNLVLSIDSTIVFNSFTITGGHSLVAGGSETITLTAVNNSGLTVSSLNGPIALTFRGLGASGNDTLPTVGGINLGGLTTLTFNNGVATATLVVTKVESATLNVTDGTHDSGTSAGGSGLALATSVGAATQLVFITPPPTTATAGVTLATAPVVAIEDNEGNTELGSTAAITVRANVGTVLGTTSRNAAAGVATFSGLTLTNASSTKLTFASAGVSSAVSSPIVVSANVPSKLAVLAQPSAKAFAGIVFDHQPVVEVVDAYGNVETNSTDGITVANNGGTGDVQGTTTEYVTNGIADFTDLLLTNVGPTTLTFSDPGVTSVNSIAIDETGGPVTGIIWTKQPGSGVAGSPLPGQPVLKTVDQYGNNSSLALLGNQNVTVTSSDGNLGGTTTFNIGTNGGNGVATFSDLEPGAPDTGVTLQAQLALYPYAPLPSTLGSFTNCQLWLDAADTNSLTLNGATVTTWADKSGHTNNATGNAGTASINGALPPDAIAGGAVVDFVGASDNVNISYIGGTPFTIITLEILNSGIGAFLNADYNAGDNTPSIGYQATGNFRFQFYADDLDYGPGSDFPDATPRIWTTEVDSTTNQTIHLNGTQVSGPRKANKFLGQVLQGHLGGYQGDIAEMLIYTKGLNDTDRSTVENYLTSKWLTSPTPIMATTDPFNVTGPENGFNVIIPITNPNGSFTLNYVGVPGQQYHVQATSSLTAPIVWSDVAGSTANADGTTGAFSFTDMPTAGINTRFYRIVSP